MITRVSFFVCILYVALVNAKSNRIIGGQNAHPGQFKYQIVLRDNTDKMCGGAIIADQYVLTAAHCVVDNNGIFYSSKFFIIAGSTKAYTHEGVQIDVEKIFIPSTFIVEENRNDIAVLRLRRGLGLGTNRNLQKIDLPSNRESSYVGHTAVISGYGYNYIKVKINPMTRRTEVSKGNTDGKLRYAMTNIISNEDCHSKNTIYKVNEDQICGQAVQSEGQPTGVCLGDSGGPLVSGNIIIGVASLGPPGCKEDVIPAIYTKVSSFIDFIEKAMKDAKTNDMLVRQILSCESSSSGNRHGKSILSWKRRS